MSRVELGQADRTELDFVQFPKAPLPVHAQTQRTPSMSSYIENRPLPFCPAQEPRKLHKCRHQNSSMSQAAEDVQDFFPIAS